MEDARLESLDQETAPPSEAAFFAAPRRLHPFTLGQRFLKSLPALFFILISATMRTSDASEEIILGVTILYGVLGLPFIIAQYLRFRYWLTADAIFIHSGVLTRRKRSIPIDRIQNIVIEQRLLPRLLGTAKVKVETAGSTTTEGVLEFISLENARRFRQAVRSYQQGRDAPAAEPAREHAAAPPPLAEASEPQPLFTMELPQILLSGMFRFSLIYIALIFSGLQYLVDLTGQDAEELAQWLLRGALRPYAEMAQAHPWLLFLATVLMAALLGWGTGIAVNLSKYYNFRLWLQDGKLHRKHGLLTLSEGTIPLKKVQSLILRSNPLMRRFGWYRLELQTMGYDVEQQGYQVAVPFAKKETILQLAPNIRPFSLPVAFTSVSRITIRRMFIRYSVGLLAAVLPLSYFWPAGLWGLAALPLLLALAVLQYRNHGYAFQDGILYVRRGVFQHYLWVVPLEKAQVFYTSSSLFQRRLRLTSLTLDTAGAGTFRYPQIVDIPAATAEAFMYDLYARFQAGLRTQSSPAQVSEKPAASSPEGSYRSS